MYEFLAKLGYYAHSPELCTKAWAMARYMRDTFGQLFIKWYGTSLSIKLELAESCFTDKLGSNADAIAKFRQERG